MNLQDSITLMKAGRKIKLPEWTGYWFIPQNLVVNESDPNPYKSIRVLTKDGDVLDTPWIDKYINRDDFQVTDGHFGFDFAILALKNGKRVYRSGWNGKGMYLMLFEGLKDIAKGLGYGFGEAVGEFTFVDVIGIKSAQNTMVLGWHPSTPDMLSNDWQIFE